MWVLVVRLLISFIYPCLGVSTLTSPPIAILISISIPLLPPRHLRTLTPIPLPPFLLLPMIMNIPLTCNWHEIRLIALQHILHEIARKPTPLIPQQTIPPAALEHRDDFNHIARGKAQCGWFGSDKVEFGTYAETRPDELQLFGVYFLVVVVLVLAVVMYAVPARTSHAALCCGRISTCTCHVRVRRCVRLPIGSICGRGILAIPTILAP